MTDDFDLDSLDKYSLKQEVAVAPSEMVDGKCVFAIDLSDEHHRQFD